MLRFIGIMLLAALTLTGCTTPDPGDEDETVVLVDLGTTGVFAAVNSTGITAGGIFDVTEALPSETPDEIRLFIEAEDLAFGTAADVNTVGITLLVVFTDPDVPDPCAVDNQFNFIDVNIDSNAMISITPESLALDSEARELAASGRFGLCVGAISTVEIPLTMEQIRLQWVLPGDVVVTSCAEVLALPEVQAALTEADSNGFELVMPTGSSLSDLEGSYALSQEVTFDPDGDNEGDDTTGEITFRSQTSSTIVRQGFNASTTLYLTGNAGTAGFCVVERTNGARCDQTIARIEALERDAATGNLVGHFLSVAVRRHDFTDPSCGARGDFIFGDLELVRADSASSLVKLRGKADLPEDFVPSFMVVSPDGDNGTVTDRDSAAVVQFSTTSPFGIDAIDLPADLEPEGFSALGISPDGSRLAVVTDLPDAALIYNNATGALVRVNDTTTSDYLGGVVDFDAGATRIFVPTTDTLLSDRLTVLRADTSTLGDIIREFTTPSGKVPVQARLSPDGTRLAMLLEGDAPLGEAAEITFGNPTTGGFSLPTLDLVDEAGGTVLASELVFSPDGDLVFLAGLGGVVAVETSSPFAVTLIDVSDGTGDSPVGLALSNDGDVLAVAIDDNNGDFDFAVIDVDTLEVLNAQDLPGIGSGRALALAHFATDRIAVVANLTGTVTAVQTESPFAADEPLSVAPDTELTTLGRVVAGGNVIAVTNIEEPAVYLIELTGSN